jgi:peroxiredoxin
MLAGAVLAAPAPAQALARVGKAAPAFSVKDEQGKKHRLADYRGKVLVLEWTNPECPFVKRHYRKKTMTRLAKAFGGREVVWLAVNSSHFNKPADTRAWRRQQGLPYATLQDPGGKLGRAFGARTTPHMFVIGPKSIVRYVGAIDDDPYGENDKPKNYVKGSLQALLAGKDPRPAKTKPYGCSVKYK